LTPAHKPNAGKAFTETTQAAQGVGDNLLAGGFLVWRTRYPQSARLDRFSKHRLNGGFCDARQGSARLFASDAAPDSSSAPDPAKARYRRCPWTTQRTAVCVGDFS